MKRTTVKLPDELDTRLRHEAERRGVTIADVTREALEAYLQRKRGRRLGFVGVGDSGDGTVAARIEALIDKEWGRSRPARKRRT
jgi:predicted transcriptional regulator